MTVLVADISNGRTKLALAREGRIVSEVHVCPTSEVTATRLALLCVGWSYEKAAFSSVVPAAEQAFRAFASRCKAVEQVRPSSRLAVSFSSYPGVSTLGGDRVANAVAAALRYPGDAVVVIDAGTATTVDVVLPAETDGGKPLFLGGAIAPGVRTMVRSLHSATAQLPEVPLALPVLAVGQGTVEALQNGCVRGYRGLIRELIAAMEQECSCRLRPVLTGGDAVLLAELMPELGEPDSLLTLRGIAACVEK